MTLIRTNVPRTPARAYYGRWIVDCECFNAIWLRSYPQTAECRLCQATIEVVWPAEGMRAGVERLLMMRPNQANRNWSPGETLHDLMLENAAHGIFDGLPLDPGRTLLVADDEELRVDLLPELVRVPRKQLA